MIENNKSPFRKKSIETYMRKQDEMVFPSFLAPKFFTYLWVLGGACIAVVILTWWYQVPVYTSGIGVAVTDATPDTVALIVFVTGDSRDAFAAGQNVNLITATGVRLNSQVEQVAPEIINPAEARAQFNLDASTGLLVSGASTVLHIQLPSADQQLLAPGSIYQAEIMTDEESLIAFFPIIGDWFAS